MENVRIKVQTIKSIADLELEKSVDSIKLATTLDNVQTTTDH